MTIFIYKISFLLELSKKVYIGKTANYKTRFNDHRLSALNNSNYLIHKAIRKYKFENTIFEVIATCLKDEYGSQAEIDMIKQYDSFHNGYNMTPGGDGFQPGPAHPFYGKNIPIEILNKRRLKLIGRKHSAESNLKRSISNTGKNIGRIPWNKGLKCSNISQSLMGRIPTKEHLQNQSISHCKVWKIINSAGDKFIVKNLKEWCNINSYSYNCVRYVHLGKLNRHKDIIYVKRIEKSPNY